MPDHNSPPEHDDTENDEVFSSGFVPSRPGRMVSTDGLIERIVEQFKLEHGENESSAVREAETAAMRRALVRDVALYILGVEAVTLSMQEQAQIIARAFSEIFGYGPLDPLFEDEQITTITLEGPHRIAVRYGPGQELTPLDPLFTSSSQMTLILRRLLTGGGAELRSDTPIIESGLQIDDRRVCVTIASPPYVPEIAADIRIHPRISRTLADLVNDGFMNDDARMVLDAIARSEHGFVIVGDTESGKTTLLTAMLAAIDQSESIVTVERAGELGLPEGAERFVTRWAVGEDSGVTFGERILEALAQQPQMLVLDEVRGDEPATITPLLSESIGPRLIWSFRGSSEPNRIRSSLSMLARLADPANPEGMVYQLQRRLPFIIVVKRRKGALHLREIAEWQFMLDSSGTEQEMRYAEYVPLLTLEADELIHTHTQPVHQLDLPESFWM